LTHRDRGLKLSEQRLVLILAYVAVALGLIVILVPVYFCLWRCSKRRKEKEDGMHELHTIYDHNYR
jgi:heme/copper-type cytochrome/quinol oxidase subunit 2